MKITREDNSIVIGKMIILNALVYLKIPYDIL